jgi:NADH:ubiquinone oxidoreductase subunit F (NADH-binding)
MSTCAMNIPVLEILRREIAAVETGGLAAPGFIELRRGAGAYIRGEESAMIESIEGKRGPSTPPPSLYCTDGSLRASDSQP